MPRPPSTAATLALVLLAALAPAGRAAAYTPAEGKAPMTVTLVRGDAPGCGADCPEWLALTGLIGPGTPALFAAALARLGRRNVPVLLDSPGGSVQAAMAIGRTVRARGMGVAVAGTGLDDCAPADRACAARRRAGERPGFVAGGIAACASACVLILAAGAERSVAEGGFVGVHQMIVHQTLTRVMNYFRVMRRMVNGRPVEVSRTLVETRPISSRQVTKAAPETMYSEVDRYLLGLGIAESIMPLMRSAPPSGIHWMTPAEVAATRIATDTTDTRTLVERAARPKGDGPARAGAMALAAAALGDGARAAGIVDWRVVDGPGAPALVGTVDVPERGLHGTLTFRRTTAPGTNQGFSAAVDFGPAAKIEPGRVWTVGAPKICDARTCHMPFSAVPGADDGQGRREFGAIRAWGDGFLSALRDDGWISLGLTSDDGRAGWVTLSIDRDIRAVVGDWEHRCCGLAPAEAAPSVGVAADRPAPAETAATASWTVEREGALPPQPGATYLTGSVSAPSVGLTLSLRAGVAQPASSGFVILTVDAATDPARFGPLADAAVETVDAVDGRAALLPAVASHRGRLQDVMLRAGAPLPPEPMLAFVLTDEQGRRIRIAVRLPDGLARLLAVAARRVS